MKYVNSFQRRAKEEGKKENLLLVLRTKFGRIPKSIKEKIEETTSSQKLASLTRQAVKAETLADLKLN